jgi:phosphohistidine swiveling domain-containing protein
VHEMPAAVCTIVRTAVLNLNTDSTTPIVETSHDERVAETAALAFKMDTSELVEVPRGAIIPGASKPSGVGSNPRRTCQHQPPIAPSPDLTVFPPGLARMTGIVVTATTMLESDPECSEEPHVGLGIGTSTYRDTARVARDPFELLLTMDPGDVLVSACTAPSFNAILGIAGAVMARELAVPAVVGCQRAMTEISPGDLGEVDPVAGDVRVIASAAHEGAIS